MPESVEVWLQSLHLEQYDPLFTEFSVSAEDLPYLDATILKDMGISKIGDRIKLARAAQKLQKIPSNQQLVSVEQIFNRLRSTKSAPLTAVVSSDLSTAVNLSNTDKAEFKLSDPPGSQPGKSIVSFILQNGSTVKLNVSGCFNATSIKKKVIKFLDLPNKTPSNYDAYLTDNVGNLHLLFDV
jgi:mitogen-activated protein kinase kinase kinase